MQESKPFRRWHLLSGNKGNSTPASLLFFDTETIPEPIPKQKNAVVHKLRLFCAEHIRLEKGEPTRRTECHGTLPETFWHFVYSRMNVRRTIYAFSHNSCFDLTELGFWKELEEERLYVTTILPTEVAAKRRKASRLWHGCVVLGSPPLIIECCRKRDGAKVIFLDTMNWFRCSLAKLGDSCGIAKGIMPAFDADDNAWYNYCRNDVAIIRCAMLQWIKMIKDYDLGNFRYTASGQAMGAFRHRFNPHGIVIHGDDEAIKLEREGYFGGECRLFQQVEIIHRDMKEHCEPIHNWQAKEPLRIGPVYVLDCQSFYPSVMTDRVYPRRLCSIITNPSIKELEQIVYKLLVVARVRISSPYNCYPVRLDNCSTMAKGNFVTTLCTPEIQRALREGDISFVGQVACYEPADLFTMYMNYFYELRKQFAEEEKPELVQLVKLIMNSLGGKLGQKSFRWQLADDVYAPVPWGSWTALDLNKNIHESFRSICWQAQRQVESGEGKDSFPAIPAHMTSYGREEMRRLRSIAGMDNVIYQDTDSLHVLENGYINLQRLNEIQPGVMGKLKVVSVHDAARYVANKHYWLNDKPVIAGIPGNARHIGGEVFEQEEWQGILSIVQGPPADGVTVRTITVDRSKDTICGVIRDNGIIDPWHLREFPDANKGANPVFTASLDT